MPGILQHPMFIHLEAIINADPQAVYDVLTDGQKFAAATGMPAQLSNREGETFTLFGGRIEGRQIELVPASASCRHGDSAPLTRRNGTPACTRSSASRSVASGTAPASSSTTPPCRRSGTTTSPPATPASTSSRWSATSPPWPGRRTGRRTVGAGSPPRAAPTASPSAGPGSCFLLHGVNGSDQQIIRFARSSSSTTMTGCPASGRGSLVHAAWQARTTRDQRPGSAAEADPSPVLAVIAECPQPKAGQGEAARSSGVTPGARAPPARSCDPCSLARCPWPTRSYCMNAA